MLEWFERQVMASGGDEVENPEEGHNATFDGDKRSELRSK